MFSGIIEHQAKVLKKEWWFFRVENKFPLMELKLWQSIAHDGACMTLTDITPGYYEFFSMQESLSVTNLWEKKIGDSLNVERCLSLWDRIDGHMVSGHIDTVWKIILRENRQDWSLILHVSYPRGYNHLVIRKWSITINGVSLTVVDDSPWVLSVSLIPLTQDWTNLWTLEIWEIVNLEFDMFAKYIEKYREKILQTEK
jgi:riboflavin synthase